MRKIQKDDTVFRENREKIRMGFVVLFLLILCAVSDHVYRQRDDWSRTLRYNYDFSGSNRYVHTLYLGCSDTRLPQADGKENGIRAKKKESCDLRSRGQCFGDSYFLLRQAARRYDLHFVWLVLDGCRIGMRDGEDSNILTEEEKNDLRSLIIYCEKEGITLALLDAGNCEAGSRAEAIHRAYVKQIKEIAENAGGAFCDWIWAEPY